ncbi:MAG: HAD-IIA family hydrolase [Promethearchaeota archaeon]
MRSPPPAPSRRESSPNHPQAIYTPRKMARDAMKHPIAARPMNDTFKFMHAFGTMTMIQQTMTPEFKKVARSKKIWILDMDGVIYKGNELIPGARAAIQFLKKRGCTVMYLTNNSTKTRGDYVTVLARHGIAAGKDEIFTSASITTNRLVCLVAREGRAPGAVNTYIIGEEGLKAHIKDAGFKVHGEEHYEANSNLYDDTHFVIAGLDRHVTYQKLFIAQNCITRGARFIATNDDATLPLQGGFTGPGSGAIISAIVTGSGRKPELGSPYGKPNPSVFDGIIEATGVETREMIMVGDRLETDILSAKRAGITSLLVMTGITTRKDRIPSRMTPDFTIESIADILNL